MGYVAYSSGRPSDNGPDSASHPERPGRLRSSHLRDPAAKRAYNVRLFSVVAPKYHFVTRFLSFDRDRHWKDELLSMLPDGEAHEVLDIACGPGDLTFRLAHKYPAGSVTGVDISPEMLSEAESARRRGVASERQGVSLDHVTFTRADMNSLPFPDGRFSVVTGGYALRNAPDLAATLDELFRVMKPGGWAVFLEFSRTSIRALQPLQYRLLRFWGNLWGRVFHGDPNVYGYIARTMRAFPPRRAFHRMLRARGFAAVRDRRRLMGFLAITVCRKPRAAQ